MASHGVERVLANHPEGMLLYGLSEWTDNPPLRRFVFANWHEDGDQERDTQGRLRSDATIELRALSFSIRDESNTPP